MATPDSDSMSYSVYSTDTALSQQPSMGTFWDIGQYRNVSRRVDDSSHLCDDLIKLMSERAHIEQRYAYKLNEWSKKWGEMIAKGPEYGSMKETWHASLVEATRTADIHSKMSNKLIDYVVEDVRNWKKNKFHKSIISCKETKRIEFGFAKAQKPWSILFWKVQKAKNSYYNTSKNYLNLCGRIDEFENTVGYSLAKVQREKEKVLRVEGHLHRAQIKYKARLDELHNYQEQYVIDMTREYDNWQEMERERMVYFVQVFEHFAKSLDISQFPNLETIHEEFDRVIKRTSHKEDLTWFSQHHGKDMPRFFPQYEEYPGSSNEEVQLMDKRVPSYHMAAAELAEPPHFRDPATTFGGGFYPKQDMDINLSSRLTNTGANAPPHQYDVPLPPDMDGDIPDIPDLPDVPGLDEQDDWLPPVRPKEIGTKMRALYDFEAEEDDDLAFVAGDVITVFGEEKDGWVQATLNGEVGYAPFDYLELV